MQNEKSESGERIDTVEGSIGSPVGSQRLSDDGEPVAPHPEKNFLDLTALIRSIQRAEGNADCYRRSPGGSTCDQTECEWRAHCVHCHSSDGKGAKI